MMSYVSRQDLIFLKYHEIPIFRKYLIFRLRNILYSYIDWRCVRARQAWRSGRSHLRRLPRLRKARTEKGYELESLRMYSTDQLHVLHSLMIDPALWSVSISCDWTTCTCIVSGVLHIDLQKQRLQISQISSARKAFLQPVVFCFFCLHFEEDRCQFSFSKIFQRLRSLLVFVFRTLSVI